jgi:curli biogenesis system outer membrane secretion channel CsgG
MKTRVVPVLAVLFAGALAGCGPDVMTSAATSAQTAAAQAQAAKQEKEILDQRIKAMQEAQQKHQKDMADQVDHAEKGSQ